MLDSYDTLRRMKLLLERKISITGVQFLLFISWIIKLYGSIDDYNIPALEVLSTNKNLIINNIIVFCIVDIFLIFIWLYLRRIPKFRKNDIGVLFAIRTDNDKVREKIKKDFFDEIERSIKSVDKKIKVITLSEYHSEKINDNKLLAKKYHDKSKAKFILYGVARNRIQNGKEHYVIEFNESISHKTIPLDRKNNIIQDMYSVFPRNSMISYDQELTGFSLNSLIFSYGSLYILGLACAYNGFIDIAYKLHKKCNQIKIESDTEILKTNFERIQKNNKEFLMAEIHFFAINEYLGECNWEKIGEKVHEAEKLCPLSYDMCTLSAIFYFHERNLKVAHERLFEAKKRATGDYTWAYSKAFLFAYEEKLDKAYNFYKLGFRNRAANNVHIQCEKFIYGILDEEPEKYQLHYCLGLLFFYKHEDFNLAREEFKIFLSEDSESRKYESIYKYVEKFINQCEN